MQKTAPIVSILLLIVFLGTAHPAFAQGTRRADEVTLEVDMANRLETMLEKIIGKERSIVKVEIRLSQPEMTEMTSVPGSAGALKHLPGVAVVSESQERIKASASPASAVPMIETIAVSIFLDEKLPQDKIEAIKKSVPQWIGLDFSRGDSLKIELIPFKEFSAITTKQISFLRKNLWVIFAVVVVVAIAFVAFLFLVKATVGSTKITGNFAEELKTAFAQSDTARMSSILQEIKEVLSTIQTQGAATAAAAEGSQSASMAIPEFLSTLRDTIAPLATGVGGGAGGGGGGQGGVVAGGGGIAPEALEVLHKIEELMKKQIELTTTPETYAEEPFKYLNTLPTKEITLYIQDEKPRTMATVLGHIDAQKSSEVLTEMPAEQRAAIATTMATLVESDQVMMEIKDFVIRKMPEVKLKSDFMPISGPKALAAILSSMPFTIASVIMEDLKSKNPSLAELVRKEMFLFEDIASLDDNTIGELLKSVDRYRLSMALSEASDQVKEKFFKSMTERSIEMIKEEMELVRPTAKDEQRKKVAFFEDIVDLDNKTIQKVFANTNRDTLKLALKGTSEEVRQKIYFHMTERGAAMLKEDIEVMPSVSFAFSQDAQKKILSYVHKLENEPIVAQHEIIEKIRELEKAGRISLGSKSATAQE